VCHFHTGIINTDTHPKEREKKRNGMFFH
jgi:hypothetical protein